MMWEHTGSKRPEYAERPQAGQESVWDYPRPPALERDRRLIEVFVDEQLVARTEAAYRVLETASPPSVYIPAADINMSVMKITQGMSFCEWKGRARYWNVEIGRYFLGKAAWSYPTARGRFEPLAHCLSFYPSMLECYINGERVRPQPGQFYGGWVTDEIIGPFKGEPGTEGW